MLIPQISVFLENRAGQLLEITDVLTSNGINLRAINIAETSDYGVLRLIADDTEKAGKALIDAGYIIKVNDVNSEEIPDEVGALGKLLKAYAAEGKDIEYMYSVFGENDGKALMVIKTK